MKKSKWYISAMTPIILLVVCCSLAAGYGLFTLLSTATGQPLVSYVISVFISIGLMITGWKLIDFTRDKGNKRSPRNLFTDTIDATKKIADGDFNISLQTEDTNGFNFYNELAVSVNQMAENLSTMEQLRQEFISNVSHEIQSPLTSISGFSTMLKQEGISPEEVIQFATVIETESRRLSRLSDNLLRLSALEADVAPLPMSEFRLDIQMENVLLMLEPQWTEKNITPEASLPKIVAVGNEDLLSQVWINLLHNAIKFTPDGGTIRVTLAKENGAVHCVISDSGIGISPEDQARIFERFYKVDKSRDRALGAESLCGGSGLGLSLAKKIVELHGGRIDVKSESKLGTEFVIILPNHTLKS
jgi:signal transduction histidine kinase